MVSTNYIKFLFTNLKRTTIEKHRETFKNLSKKNIMIFLSFFLNLETSRTPSSSTGRTRRTRWRTDLKQQNLILGRAENSDTVEKWRKRNKIKVKETKNEREPRIRSCVSVCWKKESAEFGIYRQTLAHTQNKIKND